MQKSFLLALIFLLTPLPLLPSHAEASDCKASVYAATAHPQHRRRGGTRRLLQREALGVISLMNNNRINSLGGAEAYLTSRFLGMGIRSKGKYTAEQRANQFAREAVSKLPGLLNGPCKDWRSK